MAAALLGLDRARDTGFDPAGDHDALRRGSATRSSRRSRAGTRRGSWRSPHDGYGDGARDGVLPALPAAPRRRRHGDRWAPVLAGIARLDGVRGGRARGAAPARRARATGLGVARGAVLGVARSCRCRSSSRRSTASRCSSCCRSAAVYAARTDRWAWAGIARRPVGGDAQRGGRALVPLVLIWWDARATAARARRCSGWRSSRPGVAAYCLLPVGVAAATRRRRSHAQDVWFREFAGPFLGVWDGPSPRGRARVSSCPGPASRCTSRRRAGTRSSSRATTSSCSPGSSPRSRRSRSACDGSRSRTSPTSSRRSRCRSPTRWCPSRSCRCHASCSCCSRSPSPSQPGRRSGGWRGPVLLTLGTSGSRSYSAIFATWHWVAMRRAAALTLDALGTLVELEGPYRRLGGRARRPRRAGRGRGRARGAARGDGLLPRAPRRRLATSTALARLRADCAEVLRAALPAPRRRARERRAARRAARRVALPPVPRGRGRAARPSRARAPFSSS